MVHSYKFTAFFTIVSKRVLLIYGAINYHTIPVNVKPWYIELVKISNAGVDP